MSATLRPSAEPAIVNRPEFKGQLACPKQLFGEFRRYAVYAVHTRFDRVSWFVDDAHAVDAVTGGVATIRQAVTRAEAIKGLWEA